MNNFAQIATKLLREYKNIIKKQLCAEESAKKLTELQLNRRLPTREVALYHLITKVIEKAKLDEEHHGNPRLRFSGINQFLAYMQNMVAVYQVDDKRVIHAVQSASKAMIDGIQLMSLPESRLDDEIYAKLTNCCSMVALYGVKEQRMALSRSLRSQLPRHKQFFQPLINQYQHYLEQAVSIPVSQN